MNDLIKSDAIAQVVASVQQGEINPLSAYAVFNRIEKDVKKARETIESETFDEANKHGSKTFRFESAEFTLKNGYAMLDYETDHVYFELKAKLAARKEMLDLVHKTGAEMYGEDGVQVPKVGVKNYTKDSILVKWKG